MRTLPMRPLRAAALLLACLLAPPLALRAAGLDDEGLSSTNRAESRFHERDGESLYRAICQGCHMADGRGARGAGAYPALAGNGRVAAAPYVVVTVLRGRNGMPAFGDMLDDEQVAAVAAYVRTHLGNAFPDPVGAADVKALR